MGPHTIICDIDGTLVEHQGDICKQHISNLKILKGTLEKLKEWDRKGYRLILLTGRRESVRKFTEEQLAKAGIFYDCLIMGVGNGKRILINDKKPSLEEDTAIAFSLKRNEGIKNVSF